MKIVVCAKFVPDATGERSFNDDHTVDRDDADGILSELDEYAVEAALAINEAADGGDDDTITVLTVGPDDAEDAVRRALQMGADVGVHVNDEAIHGSDAVATSLVIAQALSKIPHDLVIFGMASTDGAMGVLPAMVAERVGVPAATLGSEVSVDGQTLTIRRDGDVASTTVQVQLPAVLSVSDQANEPRYPSFKGIMAAKKKPVDEWSLDDLGVESGQVGTEAAWTRVETVTQRPPRTQGMVVTDEDGSGAASLVEFLSTNKLV